MFRNPERQSKTGPQFEQGALAMKACHFLAAAAVLALGAPATTSFAKPAAAAPQAATEDAPWPEAWFEIFKLAPGKQEDFIRGIARADEVSAAGGQPPIQIFVHQDGADWDVLLFKPVRDEKPTAEQEAAMAAKRKELNMESGPAYFVNIRRSIASHTDTKTYGPLSAKQWLARLDKWRAEHPGAARGD
jgi:hypothetical protein